MHCSSFLLSASVRVRKINFKRRKWIPWPNLCMSGYIRWENWSEMTCKVVSGHSRVGQSAKIKILTLETKLLTSFIYIYFNISHGLIVKKLFKKCIILHFLDSARARIELSIYFRGFCNILSSWELISISYSPSVMHRVKTKSEKTRFSTKRSRTQIQSNRNRPILGFAHKKSAS